MLAEEIVESKVTMNPKLLQLVSYKLSINADKSYKPFRRNARRNILTVYGAGLRFQSVVRGHAVCLKGEEGMRVLKARGQKVVDGDWGDRVTGRCRLAKRTSQKQDERDFWRGRGAKGFGVVDGEEDIF